MAEVPVFLRRRANRAAERGVNGWSLRHLCAAPGPCASEALRSSRFRLRCFGLSGRSNRRCNKTIMSFEDYKVVLYRNQPDGWVAEIPAIPGCYALMPTRDSALAELADVFAMIQAEYCGAGRPLPADTTELIHA